MTDFTADKKTQKLHEVYASRSSTKTSEIYDDWSSDYEQHMQAVGYTHPAIVASMLSRLLPAGNSPVLDAGTGTGILGGILAALGYSNLNGFDASEGMLRQAQAKGDYQDLRLGLLGQKLDYDNDTFAACVASGVFTQGHAPLEGLNELVRITRPDGYIVFTISRTYMGENFNAFSKTLSDLEKWQRVDVSNQYDSAPLAKEALVSQAFAFRKI